MIPILSADLMSAAPFVYMKNFNRTSLPCEINIWYNLFGKRIDENERK